MLTYKFCPYCKGALENISKEKGTFKCMHCKKKLHINSSPTASILPVNGNKVLLAKRAIEPKRGAYDAVGGFLELGEHPEIGVIREAKEETGLEIKPMILLGVYMAEDYLYQGEIEETLNFYYVGKIMKGRMKAKEDVSSLHWVPIKKPPKMAFGHQEKVMKDLQKWYEGKVKK